MSAILEVGTKRNGNGWRPRCLGLLMVLWSDNHCNLVLVSYSDVIGRMEATENSEKLGHSR